MCAYLGFYRWYFGDCTFCSPAGITLVSYPAAADFKTLVLVLLWFPFVWFYRSSEIKLIKTDSFILPVLAPGGMAICRRLRKEAVSLKDPKSRDGKRRGKVRSLSMTPSLLRSPESLWCPQLLLVVTFFGTEQTIQFCSSRVWAFIPVVGYELF